MDKGSKELIKIFAFIFLQYCSVLCKVAKYFTERVFLFIVSDYSGKAVIYKIL